MTDDELVDQMVEVCRILQMPRPSMMSVLRIVREHDAKHRLPETEKPRRVPVQIAFAIGDWSATRVIANDGTLWALSSVGKWYRLPDLPQD